MLEPRYWDFQSRVLPFVLRPHLKLVVQAGFEPAYASVSDSCRDQAWRLDNLKLVASEVVETTLKDYDSPVLPLN